MIFGIACSLLGALGAEAARSAGLASFRPRWRWLLLAWQLPWSVLWDTVLVFAALLRPSGGPSILRSMVYDGGSDDPASTARRALAIAYTTVSPNAVVLDVDRAHRRLVLHHIVPSSTPSFLRRLGAKS